MEYLETMVDSLPEGMPRVCYCGSRENALYHHYGPAAIDHHLLVFVVEGSAELIARREKKQLKKGQLLWMYPGQLLSYRALTPWSIRWLGIRGEGMGEVFNRLGLTQEDPVYRMSARLGQEIENLIERIMTVSHLEGQGAGFVITGLFYQLLGTLMRQEESQHGVCAEQPYQRQKDVARALQYISCYYGTGIRIGDISAYLHRNRSYLSELFCRETGMTLQEKLTQTRLQQAEHLLRQTDLSIAEIASSVGFSDRFYFSRVFKKRLGISPSEFRRSLSEKT